MSFNYTRFNVIRAVAFLESVSHTNAITMEEKLETVLTQGVAEVVVKDEVKSLLAANKPLIVKLGVDPTSPDMHLGHALPLRKLRQLQDLGHQAVLVIGDFTAGIGDPAGSNKTRPVLSEDEIKSNMAGYLDQAAKIIDIDKATVVYNSEWLRSMTIKELVGYTMQISVNSLIEREDFANRLAQSNPVSLHELLYPLFQGIDSVHLKADIELGGWDQRLNFLTARELQKKLGQAPQGVIMMKPLLGLDGTRKMSKSYDNYIAINETADQMFGKVMSIPDELIANFGELAAWMDQEQIRLLNHRHPREAKADVAEAIVARYYSKEQAITFSDPEITLIQAVTQSLKESSSHAQRLISQNGVRIAGVIKSDPREKIVLAEKNVTLQIGKHRFFELRYEK
jgi:tyrosyl-tRNA synthetase